MPQFPVTAASGDPIYRAQTSAVSQIRSYTRSASSSAERLNSGDRIVNPGDDPLGFQASGRIRSDITALGVVTETSQLNAATISIAVDGLDLIKGQLDRIKRSLVQGQASTDDQRALIQQDIDLAISQIDATSQTTRLGNRGLLNGDATIQAFQSVANDGTITNFDAAAGTLAAASGIYSVKVNKVGVGAAGNTRSLDDGRRVLSFNVSIASGDKASRALLQVAAGTSTDYTEFRVSGRYGSTTLRIDGIAPSQTATSNGFDSVIREFNLKAAETGVVLVQQSTGSGVFLQATGYGDDFFVKVEVIDGSANGATIGGVGGDNTGASAISQGVSAVAQFNGQEVRLGGEFGTTARIQDGGADIEVNFGTAALGDDQTALTTTLNIDLSTGVKGVLGISGRQGEIIQYGFGTFNSGTLGKAGSVIQAVTDSDGTTGYGGGTIVGQETIGVYSVGDIGSGGVLALDGGNLADALSTIERAVDSVIAEQSRLGIIQGAFQRSVASAETSIGNLAASDADIVGVDAATEITNLIQAQLGISTASSVLSQANSIKATVFGLLRG